MTENASRPVTIDELLRGESRALDRLFAEDLAAWELFETVWERPEVPCPPLLALAMLERGEFLRWIRTLHATLGKDRRRDQRPPRQVRSFRRWFAAGIVRHLEPKTLSSLHMLSRALWHYVEADSVARAHALVLAIEAGPQSRERRSDPARRALSLDPLRERRQMHRLARLLLLLKPVKQEPPSLLGQTLLALAWHAGEERDHALALAAAERAEQTFAKAGDQKWRSQASRYRAGALFRLRRIDEALAVLDVAFEIEPIQSDSDRLSRRADPTSEHDDQFVLQEQEPLDRALEQAALEALSSDRTDVAWIDVFDAIARITSHPGCAERHDECLRAVAARSREREVEAARREADGDNLPGPFR